MLHIKKAILEFSDAVRITVCDERELFVTMPFFFYNDRDSVTLRYYRDNGNYYISDDGAAAAYLDNGIKCVDDYRESVERIKKKFNLTETDRHAFVMELPDEKASTLRAFTGFFIQAISVIAYLRIFD